MYTDAKQVAHELARRRKDRGLQAAILEYLGGSLPKGWPEGLNATINRYVATARMEDVVFAHATQSLGLRPYWPTYHLERFDSQNPEKVSCVRPRVQVAGLQFQRYKLTKASQMDQLHGQPIGEIEVGSSTVAAVHAEARRAALGPVADNVFDISGWNRQMADRFSLGQAGTKLAQFYYKAVMALYIRDGVLFEDFDGGPNANSGLGQFVDMVVMPAFRSVAATFGLQPLIVRLPYVPGFLDFPEACAPVFDRYS